MAELIKQEAILNQVTPRGSGRLKVAKSNSTCTGRGENSDQEFNEERTAKSLRGGWARGTTDSAS